MAEGGLESEGYITYLAEDSGNVAADGNFSVQVSLCDNKLGFIVCHCSMVLLCSVVPGCNNLSCLSWCMAFIHAVH